MTGTSFSAPGVRFTYDLDVGAGLLVIRMWGYWTDDEAILYRDTLFALDTKLRHIRRPWGALVDVSQSPPQSEITQKARRETLMRAKELGMHKVAYLLDSALTKQQVRRLAGQAGLDVAFFQDRAEAEAWINGQAAE